MTGLIAWRNLRHDPIRFLATLIGIVFSVVLISVQSGLLLGFTRTATGLVDHAGADIWIASRGTTNVDQSAILSQRMYYRALKVPGIAEASRYIVRFVNWQKPQGGTELVILVGFDPQTRLGAPWNVVEGSVEGLSAPNAVMIDRLYARKLGVSAVGDRIEIAGRRAVVAGFTQGVRTFTQSPYVFTSYQNALSYSDVLDGNTSYVLVKAADGVDPAELAERLRPVVDTTDVMTAAEFAGRTRTYWIFTTGAGSALLLGATLGCLVGIVIVAQTLYAATMERIAEYATLSAIGAGRRYLNTIVLKQAMICGGLGFAIAAVIARFIAAGSEASAAAIVLPFGTMAAIGVGSLLMCALASVIAIRRLMTIDPTSVFR